MKIVVQCQAQNEDGSSKSIATILSLSNEMYFKISYSNENYNTALIDECKSKYSEYQWLDCQYRISHFLSYKEREKRKT